MTSTFDASRQILILGAKMTLGGLFMPFLSILMLCLADMVVAHVLIDHIMIIHSPDFLVDISLISS